MDAQPERQTHNAKSICPTPSKRWRHKSRTTTASNIPELENVLPPLELDPLVPSSGDLSDGASSSELSESSSGSSPGGDKHTLIHLGTHLTK